MSHQSQSNSLSEEQQVHLLTQIAKVRDRSAMEQFYLAYRIKLGAFLFRIAKNQAIVDEIYNDVMMVVWRKAEQFNHTSKVSTWVFGIAYRTGLKHLGKENKHLSQDSEVEQIKALEDSSEINLDQREIISKAMAELTLEHRTVIELAYFVGNNYAEIAAITNAPENTVKTRIFYARKKLQRALQMLGVTSMATN